MFAIFNSACSGRSIRKTRKILDAYATRTGQFSWQTPVTAQGLDEIYKQLRKTATKSTAVCCMINDGRNGLRVAWRVGRKGTFGKNGEVAIGTKKGQKPKIPDWVRTLGLSVKAAGLTHDIGKSSLYFQKKLRGEVDLEKDPVRHEWLSLLLLNGFIEHGSIEQAFSDLPKIINGNSKPDWLKKGLSSYKDLVELLISSHHGLFAPDEKINWPTPSQSHIRDTSSSQTEHQKPFNATSIHHQIDPVIKEALKALKRVENKSCELKNFIGFYRAAGVIGRVALIFADHMISSQDYNLKLGKDLLWANTSAKGIGNQPLDWHLKEVAYQANNVVYQIHRLPSDLEGLSESTVSQILKPVPKKLERFLWQNQAVQTIEQVGTNLDADNPLLIFNIAQTGAGKTVGNLKALVALHRSQGKESRISIGLNLRSLSLQTGEALSDTTGINESEMAVVIGDSDFEKLHKQALSNKEQFVDSDENPKEIQDYVIGGEGFYTPEWMNFLAKNKKQCSIQGSPLLVSTIDYLVASGEPDQQGRHVSAFFRVAGSDLILDEIDGYEPKALIAVCRVIQMATMMGRNIVCASATLSKPVADLIFRAYQTGLIMREGLLSKSFKSNLVIINDLTSPEVVTTSSGDLEALNKGFDKALKRFLAKIPEKTKVPYLVDFERSESEFLSGIVQSINSLHLNNHIEHEGKKISVGLVRIANIKTAVKVARYLSENLKDSRIGCYHANDFVINRFHKERLLDEILTRKGENPNTALLENKIVQKAIQSSDSEDLKLVVVATPVEEIGRDHDFDWAVIEPSSMSSIIQSAGRVNRHRNNPVTSPNIGILRFNYSESVRKGDCFTRPGLESGESHPNHDLKEILNWDNLNAISTKVRFDYTHQFSLYDDQAIADQLNAQIKKGVFSDKSTYLTKGVYKTAKLRENQVKSKHGLNRDLNWQRWDPVSCDWKIGKEAGPDKIIDESGTDWLSLSEAEMLSLCELYQDSVDNDYGLSFEISRYGGDDHEFQLVYDKSFGFFTTKG